jgi:hypothetical protein
MKRFPTEESKEPMCTNRERRRTNSLPAVAKGSQGGSEMEEVAELAAPMSAVQLVLASNGALRIV